MSNFAWSNSIDYVDMRSQTVACIWAGCQAVFGSKSFLSKAMKIFQICHNENVGEGKYCLGGRNNTVLGQRAEKCLYWRKKFWFTDYRQPFTTYHFFLENKVKH